MSCMNGTCAYQAVRYGPATLCWSPCFNNSQKKWHGKETLEGICGKTRGQWKSWKAFFTGVIILYLGKAVDIECLGWVTGHGHGQTWRSAFAVSAALSSLPVLRDLTICPPEPQRTHILLWAAVAALLLTRQARPGPAENRSLCRSRPQMPANTGL